MTVMLFQMLTHKTKVSKLIYHRQQVVIRHMALKAKAIKQTILTLLTLAYHIQISVLLT